MQLSFSPEPLKHYSHWAFYQKVFSPEECMKIRALLKNPQSGLVGGAEAGKNESIRKSSIEWLFNNEETFWIYERLTAYLHDVNSHRYKFDLHGFTEPLQLGLYQESGHYKWHSDFAQGFTTRKLSIVLQLSDPSEYEGGKLEFFGFENEKVHDGQGDLIFFPSFNVHRVTPVTKGERYSLVAWIGGSPFK